MKTNFDRKLLFRHDGKNTGHRCDLYRGFIGLVIGRDSNHGPTEWKFVGLKLQNLFFLKKNFTRNRHPNGSCPSRSPCREGPAPPGRSARCDRRTCKKGHAIIVLWAHKGAKQVLNLSDHHSSSSSSTTEPCPGPTKVQFCYAKNIALI